MILESADQVARLHHGALAERRKHWYSVGIWKHMTSSWWSGSLVPRVGTQSSNGDLGMRVACGPGYSALAELRYPHLDRHNVVHSINGELPSLQLG